MESLFEHKIHPPVMSIFVLSVPVIFAFLVFVFMQQPKFGKLPAGAQLMRIQASQNFSKGQFQNQRHTPTFSEGSNFLKVLRDVTFNRSKRNRPIDPIPSVRTDLHRLDPSKDVLVWFGHSSYFIQADGRKFLVDPVFSGNASPIPNSVKSFPGSDAYTASDMPDFDYLIISHDHWDHLDYETLRQLKPKIKRIITGLGTKAHLEHWGFDPAAITEKDWHEEILLEPGFVIHTVPARHFSGRGFRRAKAIWMSFVLQTPGLKIFIGGDSGYDTHFEDIGNQFGPFDLAILECGQYNANWKHIHSMPEELILEARQLRARRLLPVHWGKFALALHDWDEPIIRIAELSKEAGLPILTPLIGEEIRLKDDHQVFTEWWKKVR
jgi:L-ascorbate metabolism protein UlaG (beta-lactamase superfamily)